MEFTIIPSSLVSLSSLLGLITVHVNKQRTQNWMGNFSLFSCLDAFSILFCALSHTSSKILETRSYNQNQFLSNLIFMILILVWHTAKPFLVPAPSFSLACSEGRILITCRWLLSVQLQLFTNLEVVVFS